MKHILLFEKYTKNNKTAILHEEWNSSYSLGGNKLKSLTLWFDKTDKQPYVDWFIGKDLLYFNGLTESLNGDQVMLYYKVYNPIFLKTYVYDNGFEAEDKVRYEFTYDRVEDMSREEFYEEVKDIK